MKTKGIDARLRKNAAELYKAATELLEAFDDRTLDAKHINALRTVVKAIRS